MSLSLDINHQLGDFTLAAAFDLKGPASALFGPSGAGKTTLLQAIAGLIRPQRGRIVFNGEVWCDTAAGIFVPAHRRRIGYVFQEGRLFPHMNVRRNLLYGARARGNGAVPQAQFDEVVALLGIGHLLERRPLNLSGGEAQRIAIGRALLSEPQLLLMDEPLASLDAKRRGEILPYIETLRDRFALPLIYVSHTRAEIDRLASEVIHIEDGQISQ